MRKKYKILFSFLSYIMFSANLYAGDEAIELEANKSIFDIEKETIKAKDRVTVKYKDITIYSDQIEKLENKNILEANKNVIFTRGNQVIKADKIIYDMDKQRTIISKSNIFDTNLKLRFGGNETEIEGTSKINIYKGWVTASSYENPNYKIEADELIIYPNRKLIAKNMGINIGGKTLFKIPYYVTSLKSESQRATLFPIIGKDEKRGIFITWGFDYDRGNLTQGFMDFEVSQKKKLAIKWSNDYKLSENNKGNIFVKRYVLPFSGNEKEWDIKWTHTTILKPKKDIVNRKFFDLGYGIWNLEYQNRTTNLISTVDNKLLKDTQTDYLKKYKQIGFYNFKIDQEIGKNGEFNFEYYWTQDRKALKELTRINDEIVYKNNLDSLNTDVDLYRKLKYTNNNNDINIKIEKEDFTDINPGYVGDYSSYKKNYSYEFDIKGPKIKFNFINLDKDEYGEIFGIKEKNNLNSFLFKNKNNRWIEKIAYDTKKEWNLNFGNYYLFRKNDFFGYKPKTTTEYLFNNLYFGLNMKYVKLKKKEYEYDYTKDNNNYNDFFNKNLNGINLNLYNNDRVYKIYENSKYAKRAKKIIDESYVSEKFNIGNDNIDLPIKDSFISFNYGIENRNYKNVYIPDFSGITVPIFGKIDVGRKLEDINSKTGYKIAKDSNGNEIKSNPKVIVNTLNTRLFTTLFDNTYKINKKYDVKIINDLNLTVQKTTAKNAIYDGYDIIEVPTNDLEIGNNFKISVGNVNLQYNFFKKDGKHFQNNWLTDSYMRNYIKADIDNKRFVAVNFEKSKNFENKDIKDSESIKKDIQYGYTSEKGNNFLYSYSENIVKYYPYNEILGWDNKKYKEKNKIRKFGISFNEWKVDYYKDIVTLNDIFATTGIFNKSALKSKLDTDSISITYDTKNIKNRQSNVNHTVKIDIGTGKKTYRYLNGTPLNEYDDIYAVTRDYTNIDLMYRYEKDMETKISKNEKNLNNESKKEDDVNEKSLYNLNVFNEKIKEKKSSLKYFQIGMNFQLDETNSMKNIKLKGLDKINNFAFKIETGYSDQYFINYKFLMERPDGIFRNDINRKSNYNFRKHDLEVKYKIGKSEEQPWWIGANLEYIQDGLAKLSDPQIYESSNNAVKVNKITQGMVTVTHIAENIKWEIGGGMKWDKPDNKKLGYYPVVSFKFSLVPFPEKSVDIGYDKGSPKFGIKF